jgi:hypothetical protein
MKPLALILALSIAANAALAILFVRSNAGRSQTSAQAGSVQGSDRKAGDVTKGSAGTVTIAGVDAKTWNNLQTGDVKVLADRLRAAGFPPAVVRAVIAALVDEKYAAQRKALLAKQDETPYWQRSSFGYDSKLMSALRELNKEERNELKGLLGSDGLPNSDERLAWQRRQFGDLSTDKAEQMQAIMSDYGELRSDIYTKANGVMLSEDREKIALLEKEQRADLAAVLTPQELENYELRSSTTANQIRSQLSIFKPTESEFRALFQATRAAEAQYGSLTNAGPTNQEQATKLRESILAGLQSQLSPERFAELKQATDPKYQMTNRLVARLELPASAAVEVVEIQQDVQKRVATIRRDTTLSAEQRNAQLAELSQEATSKVSTTLTPRGLEAYKNYGGYWLQNINPPARRTTTTP